MPFQNIGDIKVHYHISGEGEPLLLIAGLFGDLHSWKKAVPFFEDKFRVITFDSRGSGLTEYSSESFSMQDMAADAATLLSELGISKAHVLGWSMGGNIAQEMAIRCSDIVGTLVLMSSYSYAPERSRFSIEAMLHAVQEGMSLSTFNSMMQAWCSTDEHFIGKSYTPKRGGRREEELHIVGRYIQQKCALDGFDSRKRLHLINAPSLIIHGDSDIMVSPRFADELAAGIADSELVWVPGAGHILPPASYAESVVQFLHAHPLCDTDASESHSANVAGDAEKV